MITVQITEHTPANMLRAIKAACEQLLPQKGVPVGTENTADSLKAIAVGSTPAPVPASGEANTAESLKEIALGVALAAKDRVLAAEEKHFLEGNGGKTEPVGLVDLDSAGQPWDPEQHSSTRSKLQDGTWKKKRGAGKATERVEEDPDMQAVHEEIMRSDPPAPVPPTPPAPPAAEVVTMNQIWGLITNKTHTLDQVLAAAQGMGFADLGSVAQTATAEQRATLLAKLTEEVQA